MSDRFWCHTFDPCGPSAKDKTARRDYELGLAVAHSYTDGGLALNKWFLKCMKEDINMPQGEQGPTSGMRRPNENDVTLTELEEARKKLMDLAAQEANRYCECKPTCPRCGKEIKVGPTISWSNNDLIPCHHS